MDDEDSRQDAILLTIYKWGAMLLIFMATVMLNIGGNPSWAKYLYMFGFLSWLVLVISSLVRDRMAEENTDKKEKLTDFVPNAVTTTVYFGFVVNAIAKKMKIKGSYSGGNKRGGADETSEFDVIKKLGSGFQTTIYMAIFMVLMNVFSNLYIYHHCEEKDENTMINSLVGAQYNILIISFLGVITFFLTKGEKKNYDTTQANT